MAGRSESKVLYGVVAVVMLVAALFWGVKNKVQVADLRAKLDAAEQKLAGMAPKEELDQALRKLERMEKLSARAKDRAPADDEEDAGRAAAVADTPTDLAEGPPGATEEGGRRPGPSGPMFGGGMARMGVEMQYAALFDELQLPEETEDEVRDIISEVTRDAIVEGMELFRSGEMTPEKGEQMREEVTETLRDELSQVLTADELAIWEEYEATKDIRATERRTDQQLQTFASGLTPENRAVVTEVVTDELVARNFHKLFQSRELQEDPDKVLEVQREAYDEARTRLATELDEEQLAHFDRYVERQAEQAEAGLGMMRLFMQRRNQEE